MVAGNAGVNSDLPPFFLYSDFRVRAKGLNLVGLKRAGFTDADIAALKTAYNILYRSALKLEDALRRIEHGAEYRAHPAPGGIRPPEQAGDLPRMSSELPRKLGLADSLAIVVGMIIGGGIFLVPEPGGAQPRVRALPSWAFGSSRAWFHFSARWRALSWALPCRQRAANMFSCARPSGRWLDFFLAGPCSWWDAQRRSSWLAVTLSLYVSYFVPLGAVESKLLDIAAIVVFAAINYRGVRGGRAGAERLHSGKAGGTPGDHRRRAFVSRPRRCGVRIGPGRTGAILVRQRWRGSDRVPAGVRQLGVGELRCGRDQESEAQRAARAGDRAGNLYRDLHAGERRISQRFVDPRNRRQRSCGRIGRGTIPGDRWRKTGIGDHPALDHRHAEWLHSSPARASISHKRATACSSAASAKYIRAIERPRLRSSRRRRGPSCWC